jgi:hypothetical protein
MADHGNVEYATATGNDYPAHEQSYERFVHFALVGILYVVTILFGLATGGVMGHWFLAATIFVIGLLGAIRSAQRSDDNELCLLRDLLSDFRLHRTVAALTFHGRAGRRECELPYRGDRR